MTTKILEEAKVEWPKPADMECKISCLKKFIQQMSMSCLAEGTCGICNIRCYKRDMRRVPLNKIPALELLKVHDDFCSIIPDIQQKKNLHSVEKHNMDDDLHLPIVQDGREADMDMQHSMNQSSFTYINDVVFYKRGLHYSLDRKKCSLIQCDICIECWSSLTKEKIPKFSVANKVWIGDIPKELQGLTIPEQRLIAIYRHNSCIVKLHSSFHSTATAQSAIKGNCISFPQNVVNIAATLPLELDELCDSLKIIFVGCRIPERNQLKTVLTVRKKKVSEALRWLRQNNPLYRNILINQSVIDKLPDDDVPECLWATMQVSTNIEAAENERASYVPDPCVNAFESNSTATVPLVPSAVLDVNGTNISSDDVAEHLLERLNMQVVDETLNTGLDKQAQENTVYMIPRGDKPANEYSNPNLLLGVFPTLFPYGCGALEDFSRPVKIDLREHLRYLLSFGDRRFEEHYSFIFVVFNILQRRTACFHAHLMTTRPEFQKSAQLLESLTSADIATALMNISKGVHSHVVDQRISTLMKHIKAVGGHVMGSAHSRSTLRTKIHSLCFYIGLPSIFLTINPADIHSPVALYFAGVNLDLDKILPEALGTSYDRAKIVATHPVATAKFFNCLIKNILKYLILGGVLGPTKAYFGTVENQGRGSLHIHLLIWLNHEFTPAHLKEQIQNEDFREKLLKYLEDIVKEDLDQFRDEDEDGTSAASDNRPSFQETEAVVKEVVPACLPTPNPTHDDFQQIFRKDVIRLVETSNIHRHSATCYKYSKAKSDDKKSCRMRMPRALVEKSNIDVSTGQITMRRSHPWINNFNEWLISACRSNMDIKFIWTGNDAKALVAVLDVNGTNISSDDVAEHLLERLNMQVVDETLNTGLDKQAQENTVYMIPRGDKPANEYSNPNLLLGIFPTLFPYGCGALEDFSRPVKIDLREHLRYLLSFGDRRFEEHYSFIFVVFNILQRRTACFHAHLMTTRPEFQKSAQLLESLTSADIATALVNISKGIHSHVVDQRISTLMKHIKAVGGHVMGSAHSRSTLRTKIHSLCFYIGLPSIFLTINPADIHSPVALYFAGVNLDLDKILPEALGTSYDRAKIVATHPVATAKFFNCLIKNILKYLILGGVLGPTKAYFGTVENQGRGSLHIHLLIWLNHEFTPAHLKEQIQNEDFREKLLKYLEDIVKEDLDQFRDEDEDETSAASDNRSSFQETEAVVKEVVPACLPTPNPAHDDFQQIFRKDVIRLVETSNIHRHSATCYKYSKAKSDDKKTCRMRMPRALVEKSNIDVSTGQITMRRSHPWINNFNEWLISACRSNMDIKFIWTGNDAKALVYYITDYVTKSSLAFYDMFALALVEKSNIDVSTGQITMRRSHPWINNFNEWLISACRSNMDIKFIWTGNDAKALVYYITDYVTKSSLAFYDMFALAQQGIKSIEQHGSTNGFDNAVEKSRKLVLRCYNMIASHQEISGVQVASYLMNYGDHYTTHTFRNLFLISIESYLQKELVKSRVNEKHIDEEETDGKKF
ncbi:unnamed protein product [Adineta steineri]|uniref:Helitron helicase-like domain-containing protein n=1 Tax=Adineta steineri TaxID=433720 RepID=A0A813TY68_9BILA|nr:unnamed protein product [Adineta steineri]